MEVKIQLDNMTERYVRSMEAKMDVYKARLWTVGGAACLVGFIIGLLLGVSLPR